MSAKKAIYPGTFDPVTLGHLDIIKRACKLFDYLYIALGDNPSKTPLFTKKERKELLIKSVATLPNTRVIEFSGLLVDTYKKLECDAIVRGLRALSDFEYEFQFGLTNRRLYEDAELVFLIPSANFIYLDSSVVRTISMNNGDVSQFVNPIVEKALKEKYIRNADKIPGDFNLQREQ
ncbi:MAG: pantetheine-phosphate adenylyltransferase [Candidatus Zixiibacteriota bacterium]